MSVGDSRAVEFVAPREVDVIDIDRPVPGAGEVLVETEVSAVSAGTELLVYRGDLDPETAADEELAALDGDLSYPVRYGYSVVGTVTEVGTRVDPAWRGRTVFGFNPHESHFIASPDDLHPVPEGIDPETAAMFANTETAVNFALDGAPRIGEHVAVFGQGVVGLLATALFSRSAAETVVAVEPLDYRREIAAELGADVTVDPSRTDAAAAVAEHTGGVDLAVEVSGRPETLETAVEATRFDGRVLVGSWYGTKRADLGFGDHFHRGRISVESSQVSTIAPELRGRWDHERRRATAWRELRRLAEDRTVADALVTDRVDVEDAAAAYHRLTNDTEETLQILLTY